MINHSMAGYLSAERHNQFVADAERADLARRAGEYERSSRAHRRARARYHRERGVTALAAVGHHLVHLVPSRPKEC